MKKVIYLVLSFFLGCLLTYLHFNYNLTQRSFDLNRDGIPDVQYLFRPNHILKKMRIDRNHNGSDDTVIDYDRYGVPINEHSDDNFDGVYDTDIEYKWGLVSKIKIDTDQDGKYEAILLYDNGVLDSIVYLENGQERTRDELPNLKVIGER